MEFRQLNTFLTVARLNSITQAADQLNYAQSSVTTQIQALESDLGVQLFERLGKSISLTPEGNKLLPYAKQILKLCGDARNDVAPSETLKGKADDRRSRVLVRGATAASLHGVPQPVSRC